MVGSGGVRRSDHCEATIDSGAARSRHAGPPWRVCGGALVLISAVLSLLPPAFPLPSTFFGWLLSLFCIGVALTIIAYLHTHVKVAWNVGGNHLLTSYAMFVSYFTITIWIEM